MFAVREQCAPGIVEVADVDETTRERCRQFIQSAAQYSLDESIDTVVIGASWQRYLLLSQGSEQYNRAMANLEQLVTSLVVAGKRVYLLLDAPSGVDFDPRRMINRDLSSPGFSIVAHARQRVDTSATSSPVIARLVNVAGRAAARVVDPVQALCDGNGCRALGEDGKPIYRDQWNLRPSYVRDHLDVIDVTLLAPF